MNRNMLLSMVFAGAVCGLAPVDGGAQSVKRGKLTVASIDPCKLVTKDEIRAAIEAKRNPSELARLKAKGIAWTISTTMVPEGEARVCKIHWQGDIAGTMHEQSDILIRVSNAEYFKANVADINRVRSRNGKPALSLIQGIGDEAYFFGYSEKGDPEARVGDVAIGVELIAGTASVDLLRAAVARVH